METLRLVTCVHVYDFVHLSLSLSLSPSFLSLFLSPSLPPSLPLSLLSLSLPPFSLSPSLSLSLSLRIVWVSPQWVKWWHWLIPVVSSLRSTSTLVYSR